MNINQLETMKESYHKEVTRNGKRTTLAGYVKYTTDSNVDMCTGKDLVMIDTANSMVHCVCVNNDVYSQADYPVKVISTDAEHIHAVEAVLSKNDFITLITDGFMSTVVAGRTDFIKKWLETFNIQAQGPVRATPYFNEEPTIIPSAVEFIDRDDATDETEGA